MRQPTLILPDATTIVPEATTPAGGAGRRCSSADRNMMGVMLICHSGAMRSIEPGISRFRVWSFGPSWNDGRTGNKNEQTRGCPHYLRPGPSGAAVAWSLADTKMHILCLDQGGWMKQSEYPSTGRDWEAKFYGEWATSPNIRGRAEDYPINDNNSPIKVVNFNGVGGSTIMYTAHWPRLHPSDFRVKTLDGVADDWPIDYDTLEPFFEENDRMMGVSGLSGDPLSPLSHPPMPPQPLGLSGPLICKAMNKLGWHWWPSDTTVATMDYEGRGRCINLGHCTPA